MSATDALVARVAALSAGMQPKPPLNDPIVTLSMIGTLIGRPVLVLPLDPRPADISPGTIRVAKNTSTGLLSIWVNDGGTMVNLLSFTPAS